MSELGATPGAPEPTRSDVPPAGQAATSAQEEASVGPSAEPASAPPTEAPARETAAATPVDTTAPSAVPGTPGRSWRQRLTGLPHLRARSIHLPRSRRGILALLLVLAGFGGVTLFTGASLIHWTETADFCGRCHQMGPELAAYDAGPHRDVACAECHVEPGIVGWVKAKVNGTKQLAQVILGLYPKPVPPPDHANLPPTSDTCQRCHTVQRLAIAQMKTKTQFAEDEANTRQFIGLMIRPSGGDVFDVNKSVHWHVLQDVEYLSSDGGAQRIDLVTVKQADGAVQTFIAQNQVKSSDAAQADIDRLSAQETRRRMDCLDCHNRVGHPIPNPRSSMDYDLSTGRIDPTLPYIKREGMRILWSSYPNLAAADEAADALRGFYQLHYPAVAASKAAEIEAAVADLKDLYRRAATPDMKVSATTYPDDLGHMDFPGCFRCHDGGHYLVKDGAVTNQVIPATCDTCHTFPQIGAAVASLPLGVPPTSHSDPLYVFNHRSVATNVDPGGTTCGDCHAKDYCQNCHKTGAVNVDHEQMLTNHAAVIRSTGNQACAYCHQPVYCARCHTDQVLPVTGPTWGAAPTTGSLPPTSGGLPPTSGGLPPTSGAVPKVAAPPAAARLAWPLLSVAAAVP